MHDLLRRQIKRYLGDKDAPEALASLLAAIDQTYAQNDQDRELLERSLDLSSLELNERYDRIEQQLHINKAAQDDLEKTLSLLDATLDATAEGILVVDLAGRVVKFNEVFLRIWGIPREILNQGDTAALNAALQRVANPSTFIEKIQAVYADPTVERFGTIALRDGRLLDHYTRPQMLQDQCVGRVWSFRDVTEQKTAESRLQLARRVFEVSPQGILIADPTFHVIDANRSLCEMLGVPRDELLGRHLRSIDGESDGGSFNENLFAKLASEGEWWGELRTRGGEDAGQVVWINFSTARNADGVATHYVGMFSDITRLKDVEQQLQQLAYYDPLTGLPNRRMFKERLEQHISGARAGDRQIALLYVDLDRFKFVNDSLGHLAGDQLLVGVSERINKEIRRRDMVSRQGGDEFTVALFNLDDESAIGEIATRIIESLSHPFRIKGQEAYIGASIGICLMPQQAQNFEEALRKADTAMYLAKASGKGRYCFWDRETQAAMESRVQIETDLRDAIRHDQLAVHFQPIVDCNSGELVSMEALLRWHHPQRGLIGPDRFIPIAEEIGLISGLEHWVIEHSCRHLDDWRRAGLPLVPVSVNVSAQHLSDRRLEQRILAALTRNAVPPTLLAIEVTESTAMHEPTVTVEVLRGLQAHGIRSAIDDFGTGYSSLSYLKQLPADKLKIDRSFVHDLTNNPNDRDIAKAIIDLAHSLSMQTVAEGVEDREQLAVLRAMGCDLVQGWLFAKAMPAADTAAYLDRQRRGVGLRVIESASPASG